MTRVRGAALFACGLALVCALWLVLRGPSAPRGDGAREDAPVATSQPPPDDDELAGAASLESERDAADAAPVASMPQAVSSSSIQFLSLLERRPIRESRWRLSADGEHALELTTDVGGVVTLPSGSWSLRSGDGAWRATADEVRVAEGERTVVFAQRVGVRRFRVIDIEGRGIAGAEGRWIAQPSDARTERAVTCTARAAADGSLAFEGCAADCGTAVFLAEGYERERRTLSGGASEQIDVVMHRSTGAGRTLRFRSCVDSTPVYGVLLSSLDGYLLASARADENVVLVPVWIAADEPLRAESTTTCSSWLRLGDLASDDVCLLGRRTVEVAIVDPRDCEDGALVTFRSPFDTSPYATVSPIEIASGSSTTVDLPLGIAVAIEAINACGERATASIAPLETPPRIELAMSRAPCVRLHVRDEDGAPMRSARARARREDMGELVVRADASGTIAVPIADELRSVRVDAAGHSSVTASWPGERTPPSADEDVDIVLERAFDVTLRCVNSSGAPVAGLLVRASSPPDRETARRLAAKPRVAGWNVGRSWPSVSGVTDTRGEFVARGMKRGHGEVDVDLGDAFAPSEPGWTLYRGAHFEIRVEGADEHVLTVPALRNVALCVVDARTQLPVRAFRVFGTEHGKSLEVPGDVWHGWISDDVTELNVAVDEIGSVRVDVREATASSCVRVEVSASAKTHFRIEGLPAEPDTIDLRANVYTEIEGGGWHALTFASVSVGEERAGSVVLDHPGRLAVGLSSCVIDGRRWSFEPAMQSSAGGAELVFRAKREPD
ncbi:MAG: hypothetical protein ACKVWV_15685 [Planctomycetota bacterium]